MFGFKQHRGAVVVDGQHIADTLQCVHCGYTWEVEHGSGKKRGFCLKCNGAVCGAMFCMVGCNPFEARLDFTEALDAGQAKIVKKILADYPDIKPI